MNIYIVLVIVLVGSLNFSQMNSIDFHNNSEKTVQSINHSIVGTWRIISKMEDYGINIRQVTFDSKNNVTYYPAFERQDHRIFSGAYWISADTVKIKFNDENFFEFYKYRIADGKLHLLKLGEYFNNECLLNNARHEDTWERANE